MPEVVFAIPGDLASPTGGYGYDRRVMELLPQFGWRVRHVELPGDFPSPSPASLDRSERRLAATPPDALLLIDGLAYGAMPAALIDRLRRGVVALVHHPLAFETGLTAERAQALMRTEREALARAVHVVVTSPATASLLAREFAVPAAKLSMAEPGTDPAPRARGSAGAPRLLSVGSVIARKGYDTLLAALAQISDLAWESRIAGGLDTDPALADALRAGIERTHLQHRVSLLGSLDETALAAEYDSANLFVLASRFEGYGMVFTEAMARGLPVVACAGGAVSTTVPAAAGLLVPPDDADAFAAALRRLLTDPAELARRADAAWQHAQSLPRWDDTARSLARALDAAYAKAAA